VEKEAGIYEFSHQTFQEYLAALQIKERGEESLLLEQLSNDRWQEVICFYAALGSATNLINAALDNPNSYTLKLANRCRKEGRDVDPQTLTRLEQALLTLPLSELEFTAEVRLEQRFRRLGIIDNYTAIGQGYITWGEYQLFLDAQATGQFHSQATLVEIDPEQLNQPVTGIRWEDARWFCAWLGTLANLQRTDEAGNGVSDYRLPTEEELQQFPAREPGQQQLVAWTSSPNSQDKALRVVRVQRSNRYKALLNYLANGRWREADEETSNVMVEVAGQKDRGYLDIEDIKKFPCEDLQIIDQLWVKFSGGHFGFSVQKQIYVETGNKPDGQYYEKGYERFGDRVGWRGERGLEITTDFPNGFASPALAEYPKSGEWNSRLQKRSPPSRTEEKSRILKPAKAGLVCIAAVSTAKLRTRNFPIRKYRFILMVKCLISDIVSYSSNIIMTDRKCSIAPLPFEEFTRFNFVSN
jgi:hypothetical protein